MKMLPVAAALLLMLGAFCGPVEDKAEMPPAGTETTQAGDFSAIAFREIAQPEMDRFLQVLPKVSEQLNAEGFKPKEIGEQEVGAALASMIDDMGTVSGVADACKQAGMEWKDFRETMIRTMAATAGIGIDMAAAMAAEMGPDTTTAEGREILAELEKAKGFSAQVPQANKDMVMKHMDQLEALSGFGGE